MHPRHSGVGIADRACQRALTRSASSLAVEPYLEALEDGSGLGLSDLGPLVGRQASRCLLDGIEFGDPPDGRVGNDGVYGGVLGRVPAGDLAPDMGDAGDLAYLDAICRRAAKLRIEGNVPGAFAPPRGAASGYRRPTGWVAAPKRPRSVRSRPVKAF